MKRTNRWIAAAAAFFMMSTCLNVTANETDTSQITLVLASKEECADIISGYDSFYEDLSQKSIDFFLQKKGGTSDEYRIYAAEQACEWTDEEAAYLTERMEAVEAKLAERGMILPKETVYTVAATTMKEAGDAGGYTHGTTAFLSERMIAASVENENSGLQQYYDSQIEEVLAHELFHCLTRNNPDFREAMYSIIHFKVNDKDFEIPEYVHEQMIANPDVEHHDSYASFTIDGEEKDCYLVFLCDGEFEKEGDTFFDTMYTGVVTVDDGTMYRADEVEDFWDVLGRNTYYVEDPEECMATNFSYAVCYGMDGQTGEGYESPEIIEAIIDYCSGK